MGRAVLSAMMMLAWDALDGVAAADEIGHGAGCSHPDLPGTDTEHVEGVHIMHGWWSTGANEILRTEVGNYDGGPEPPGP